MTTTRTSPPKSPQRGQRWPLALLAGALLFVAACGTTGGSDVSKDTAPKRPTTTSTTTTTEAPTTTSTTIPAEQLVREVQAEVDRACAAAFTDDSDPRPDYKSRWASVTDREKMHATAVDCLNKKKQAAIDGAQPVDIDAIVKNPDATIGQTFTMVVLITQFDAATGACTFRGYWDNEPHEYNFEYAGDNAYFGSGDADTNCPVLDGIDQNDTIRVWATSIGSLSYDTQVGGSTTVPAFKVLRAEVLKKE